MPRARACEKCGFDDRAEEDPVFCTKCGARLPRPPDEAPRALLSDVDPAPWFTGCLWVLIVFLLLCLIMAGVR